MSAKMNKSKIHENHFFPQTHTIRLFFFIAVS